MNRILFAAILLLLPAQRVFLQPPDVQPKRDGVIAGQVVDEAGQPIADAQIIIDKIGERIPMQFVNTDGDGRFKVTGLLPGLYAMDAKALGYVIAPGSPGSGVVHVGDRLTISLIKGGVLTGRVTDPSGEPVVAINVYANRLRDLEGRPVKPALEGRQTDDRGVYRLYGLSPGIYIVSIHAGSGLYVGGSEAVIEKSTYYPSAAREAAAEIPIRAGEEIAGIDIQHRGERGHAISGTLTGDIGSGASPGGLRLKLVNTGSGEVEQTANPNGSAHYAFYGVPEGEYDVYAQKAFGNDGNAGSAPRRVVVSGADVTGVDLRLVKYGSISGRVLITPAKAEQPTCESKSRFGVEEVMVEARSDDPVKRQPNPFFTSFEYWGSWRGSVVSRQGEFTLNNLEAGRYRIEAGLPDENWYVRSITQPSAGAAKKPTEVSRAAIAVKSGGRLAGIDVIIAEGAATLRGRAITVDQAQVKTHSRQPLRLRAHLIPSEAASADDVLRYAEAVTSDDGSFEFKNLAPGKYWLLARPIPQTESIEIESKPLSWDPVERAKLRREAEALKSEVEIQPCQRVSNYELRMAPGSRLLK